MPFEPLALIPVYDHEHAVGAVLDRVLAQGLKCLLIDDGSSAPCALALERLAQRSGVTLLRLPSNSGKGAAMIAGFKRAAQLGATHALQIDADGQHDTGDIAAFLADARQWPDALICGVPRYDASAPRSRLYARYLTHVWVWINTLSLDLTDSMCGFRVYPLAATLPLIESERIGARMDFDTEILVRLYWRGVRVIERETAVTYPSDGVSHFRLWRDNARLSLMHARLFAGMLRRAPRLLSQRGAKRRQAAKTAQAGPGREEGAR